MVFVAVVVVVAFYNACNQIYMNASHFFASKCDMQACVLARLGCLLGEIGDENVKNQSFGSMQSHLM
jgi:hypothetical protein